MPQRLVVQTIAFKSNPIPRNPITPTPITPTPLERKRMEPTPIPAIPVKQPDLEETIVNPTPPPPVPMTPAPAPEPTPKPETKPAVKQQAKPAVKPAPKPQDVKKPTPPPQKKPEVHKPDIHSNAQKAAAEKAAADAKKKQEDAARKQKKKHDEEAAKKEAEKKLVERERQQKLVAMAQESIAKISGSSDKGAPKRENVTLSAVPHTIGGLEVDALAVPKGAPAISHREMTYRDELASRLKLMMRLPEYGDVKINLTLDRTGKVLKVEIVSTESKANRSYVEKTLPGLTFPSFGANFESAAQYTFPITLSNE